MWLRVVYLISAGEVSSGRGKSLMASLETSRRREGSGEVEETRSERVAQLGCESRQARCQVWIWEKRAEWREEAGEVVKVWDALLRLGSVGVLFF